MASSQTSPIVMAFLSLLQYLDTIDISKVQQWDNFLKSLEIKDKAPTEMNKFLYGSGLKILLGIILVLTLSIYKFVRR